VKETIVVWFSCGAASAVAAKETVEKYGRTHNVRVVNNPVDNEDPDNKRFLTDVEKWLGVKIESAINPDWKTQNIEEVFEKRKYMSGPMGAPCTVELKKKARYHWEKSNSFDHVVLGFTSEETGRSERFQRSEPGLSVLPVLIDAGISKDQCFQIISNAGIALPAIYSRGYPNANCIGCVKASSSTYWNLVREKDPDVFANRSEMSRRIGSKLVWYKGKRIYLDELPVGAKGRSLKTMNVDCGIFCEIK
jgi:hypothetical protein